VLSALGEGAAEAAAWVGRRDDQAEDLRGFVPLENTAEGDMDGADDFFVAGLGDDFGVGGSVITRGRRVDISAAVAPWPRSV
jgi:hypothetical protein